MCSEVLEKVDVNSRTFNKGDVIQSALRGRVDFSGPGAHIQRDGKSVDLFGKSSVLQNGVEVKTQWLVHMWIFFKSAASLAHGLEIPPRPGFSLAVSQPCLAVHPTPPIRHSCRKAGVEFPALYFVQEGTVMPTPATHSILTKWVVMEAARQTVVAP